MKKSNSRKKREEERDTARVASRTEKNGAAVARGSQGTTRGRGRGRGRGIARGGDRKTGRGREVNGETGRGGGSSGHGPAFQPDARGWRRSTYRWTQLCLRVFFSPLDSCPGGSFM